MDYLAICPRLPGNELAAAECEALTGAKPARDGIALCDRISAIPRAAYVNSGARRIAEAPTLDELVQVVAEKNLAVDDFRIEFVRLVKSSSISGRQAVVAVANAVQGFPNLEQPSRRLVLLARENQWALGETVIEADQSYKQHAYKPYHLSSSLPAQMARALVNLLPEGTSSLLDPCCGTGSVLLEAAALGMQAFGSDLNLRMVAMARKNLAYFGYPFNVTHLDARQQQQTTGAVVTDLPYGRFSSMNADTIQAILQNCARLAPIGIFVAGMDIRSWLFDAGYATVDLLQVRKRQDFSRFVHRAQI